METSRISLSLTLITMLLVGTLMSETAFAAGSWSGGGHASGGRAGGGQGVSGGHAGGGARAGGPGFSGGGRAGGRVGRPGFSGGRHAGSGWNRGRSVGIYVGAPIGLRYGSYPYSYYGAPYYGVPYYPPAPVYYPLVQPAPVTYIERNDEPQIDTQAVPNDSSQDQDAQESWWYYCVDAKAYYPYVNQCPAGWLRVAPQPASSSDDQPALDNSPAP